MRSGSVSGGDFPEAAYAVNHYRNSRSVNSMTSSHRFLTALFSICVLALIASPSLGMISVGVLTEKRAKEKYGITMHARKNGDAGIKVWLEFKKEGWLEKFTYAELRMEDADGKHLLSAQLQPNPVHHRQAEDLTTVAFSADADQLGQCSFLVVCYGSNEGDVGYYLKVKDFLDLDEPVTDDLSVPLRGSAELQEPNSSEAAKAKLQKLQQDRLEVLQQAVKLALALYRDGALDFRTVHCVQQDLLEAKHDMAETRKEQIGLLTSQLKIAKDSLAVAEEMYQAGATTVLDVHRARSAFLSIEIRLLKLRVIDKTNSRQPE